MDKKTIYFAGGCFWGVEKLFEEIYGVVETKAGYANGKNKEDAVYEKVKKGNTGYKECVKVVYDVKTNLSLLLDVFFKVVNPSIKNRQGNDIGTQYQSGIYYRNESDEKIVKEYTDKLKLKIKDFSVETEYLTNFYEAEEYHQKYLDKNPTGYCHIPFSIINKLSSESHKNAK